MRAAAILGLGSSPRHLQPFAAGTNATWSMGLPTGSHDADAILVFGGDGTVHRHLAGLVKLQLPVLVVPQGSGNDFARALNLRSPGAALAAWRQFASGGGKVRKIDLGVIAPAHSSENRKPETGTHFCCVGGVGLDVEVARRANRLPRALRRRGGYPLSLLPGLFRFKPLTVKVVDLTENGRAEFATRHEGPAMLVAFANTSTFGGGLRIAPGAQLDDGKLEVCIVSAMTKPRLLRLFPSVYSGNHVKLPEVKYFRASRLRIETGYPSEVYADGEYVCATPVETWAEAGALQVIVP